MTKKHLKYPVMGCVTDEELRGLVKGWNVERLYKTVNNLDKDIENLEGLLDFILEQRQIVMKVLKKREAKKYG